MRFATPLVPATLIRRYKRFLADVQFDDGTVTTAHCANPGAMLGLAAPGSRIWLSAATKPGRKLRWSWELVELKEAWAGINTSLPNRLAEEAIVAGAIPELAGYAHLRREVKYGRNSRIDLLLEDPTRIPAHVEIKNVHLKRQPGLAEFPDCVTRRGAKHLDELAAVARAGGRAVLLFVVQYTGLDRMALAADLDPAYAAAMGPALQAGLEVLCYDCIINRDGIALRGRLPFTPPS